MRAQRSVPVSWRNSPATRSSRPTTHSTARRPAAQLSSEMGIDNATSSPTGARTEAAMSASQRTSFEPSVPSGRSDPATSTAPTTSRWCGSEHATAPASRCRQVPISISRVWSWSSRRPCHSRRSRSVPVGPGRTTAQSAWRVPSAQLPGLGRMPKGPNRPAGSSGRSDQSPERTFRSGATRARRDSPHRRNTGHP